jgi:hypothetical protein
MNDREFLYDLLPAIYRRRDGESGNALRALTSIIDAELEAVRADTETAWDNWFIETAEEWLVPYLASSLRLPVTRDVSAISFSQRAFVANTIGYRRRKGTVGMIELLARDVTNYPARAVEFFQRLAWTEALNHQEGRAATLDLRDAARLERLSGPLGEETRRVDVRRISSGRGQHNLPNIGLFLWRSQIWRLSEVDAAPVAGTGDRGWWFRPTGESAPLYAPLETENDPAAVATEASVPIPLSRRRLWARAQEDDGTNVWPFTITLRAADGTTERIPPARIDICHLDPVPAAPTGDRVSVDPQAGVLLLGQDAGAGLAGISVTTSHYVATPGTLGAGPWNRQSATEWVGRWTSVPEDRDVGLQIIVSQTETGSGIVATFDEAVAAWHAFIDALDSDARSRSLGLILVGDSRSYAAPASAIRMPSGAALGIVAGSWPDLPDPAGGPPIVHAPGVLLPDETRPMVVGDISLVGEATSSGSRGELYIDGLLVDGSISVLPGALDTLSLASTSLIGPGTIAIDGIDGANATLEVEITRSILGGVDATDPFASLSVVDSAVLGSIHAPGIFVNASGTTILGPILAGTLEATDCIFEGLLEIEAQQEGCVRFCYLPPQSQMTQRYRCQPDVALVNAPNAQTQARILARVRPQYRSLDPLASGFLLFEDSVPAEIRQLAEDGGEPGCWNHLQHETRVANLRNALPQFLRFGMEPGLFFLV